MEIDTDALAKIISNNWSICHSQYVFGPSLLAFMAAYFKEIAPGFDTDRFIEKARRDIESEKLLQKYSEEK